MNFRELLNKLDEAEATPAVDPARAQYDKFKADDARASAIEQVKQMTKPSGMGNFIDPKDGVIKWQEQNAAGGPGSVREFPFDWYKKGQEGQFFNLLKAAGLEVVPVERKGLFGTSQVAAIDPQKLATLGQDQAAAPTGTTDTGAQDKIKRLIDLVKNLKCGQEAKEGFELNENGSVTLTRHDGTQVTFDPTTLLVLEDNSMSGQLMESFGYNRYMSEAELAEYSWDQFKNDAGDFGQGVWQGATLGTGSNIAAGAKSLFKGTKYKDELKKELDADKAAQARSPWLYGTGNVAGAIGSSMVVPGSGVGNLAARGAAKMGAGALGQGIARGAAQVGGNLALQKGIDTAVSAHNKDVLGTAGQAGAATGKTDPKLAQLQKIIGAKPDGKMGPETKEKLQAWQQSQGIAADGVPGPETYSKAGIKESAAEQYARLRDRLAMLETEQKVDELSIPPALANLGSKAMSGLAGLGKSFVGGMKNPEMAKMVSKVKGVPGGAAAAKIGAATGKAGGAVAGAAKKVGGAMARNPGKTALGTAALGYGLSQLGGDQAAAPTGHTSTGGGSGGAVATGNCDPAQMAEINQLMADLAQYNDPQIQQAMAQVRQMLSQATGDKNVGSADKPVNPQPQAQTEPVGGDPNTLTVYGKDAADTAAKTAAARAKAAGTGGAGQAV